MNNNIKPDNTKLSNDIQQAAACLKAGGIICYPTEQILGLSCLPENENAFKRLLDIKGRPADKGVILLASQWQQLTPYLAADAELIQQTKAFWPGFNTLILPKNPHTPAYLSGQHAGIALRLSHHPRILALCDYVGSAIISTSANPTGAPPFHSVKQARDYFQDAVDYYAYADWQASASASASAIYRYDLQTKQFIQQR